MSMPAYEPRGPSPMVAWILLFIFITTICLLIGVYALHASWLNPESFGTTATSMVISGVGILGGVSLLGILVAHDAGKPRH